LAVERAIPFVPDDLDEEHPGLPAETSSSMPRAVAD
jgi:hypothetical protein